MRHDLVKELSRRPVMDRQDEGGWDSAERMIPLEIGGSLPNGMGLHEGI